MRKFLLAKEQSEKWSQRFFPELDIEEFCLFYQPIIEDLTEFKKVREDTKELFIQDFKMQFCFVPFTTNKIPELKLVTEISNEKFIVFVNENEMEDYFTESYIKERLL